MSTYPKDSDTLDYDVEPPWGSLPPERYILKHWDNSRSIAPAEQLRELVQECIKTGYHDISTLPIVQPTQDQVATILSPWRSVFQRDMAINPGPVGCVWLRTYYGLESKHEALLENVDLFMALHDEDRILNDPDLYDFGGNWRKILDVMPELVMFDGSKEELLQQAVDELVKAAAALREHGEEAFPKQVFDHTRPIEPGPLSYTCVLQVLQGRVHASCVENYIIVEDKQSLETGQLLLAFLDAKGRVVRSSRVDAPIAADMSGFWLKCSWDDLDEFLEADLGEDYQAGGICGYLLHM